MRGKRQLRPRSRTHPEAERRAEEVFTPDGHLLKGYGEESLNLEKQVLQEELP